MATGSNVLAKNEMLQAILDWDANAGGTTMKIGAYTSDADGAVLASETATYGTPATSAMDITTNVVLNIDAGESVSHLRIEKPATGYYIYKKDITTESFTYAGTITITSAEISIADAA